MFSWFGSRTICLKTDKHQNSAGSRQPLIVHLDDSKAPSNCKSIACVGRSMTCLARGGLDRNPALEPASEKSL